MEIIKYLTKNNLLKIKRIIENGGIIIFPTDTVYGISCNSLNVDAIKKLYRLKNRNENKPIGVLTDSYQKIEQFAVIKSEKEKELMKRYFPGELTIILEKKDIVPDELTSGQNTIGVRIPNHKKTLKILEQFNVPLATTSLNLSGEKPMNEIERIKKVFEDKVDLMIIGKINKEKKPSTIVKVIEDEIIILREGNLILDK